MNQGKIMNIYLLRQLCLTILSGKSLNETKAQLNVARSTVIRYKKKLRDAKIMSYSSLLALNDDEFIRAMYGAKAVVEKSPARRLFILVKSIQITLRKIFTMLILRLMPRGTLKIIM